MSKNRLITERIDKSKEWREKGGYPNVVNRTLLCAHIPDKYKSDINSKSKEKYYLVGRLMAKRVMGKSSFAKLIDESGEVQLFCSLKELNHDYELFKQLDLGDIIEVHGEIFKTKTNEISIKASSLKLLSKCLSPLPEKYHGLVDEELKVRKRYLDLIMNKELREKFKLRSVIIKETRRYLDDLGYMEVETPMLQDLAGGALAKPFKTFHNERNKDLYLRIAPELYLKRLIVGGYEKIYELNRNFRNEGVSTRHNPEFTMVEAYTAYATYRDCMELVEGLIRHVVKSLGEKSQLVLPSKFDVFSMVDIVKKTCKELQGGGPGDELRDTERLKNYLVSIGSKPNPSWGWGKLLSEIFEAKVEHLLIKPTFITHYPLEVSPLARSCDNDSEITERFELFIAGKELANGFSELNNPLEQERRFKIQADSKSLGDEEAMEYDQDYINALEHGLPPTTGFGIGIDRLVMLLLDVPSIRDVIFFPQLKKLLD